VTETAAAFPQDGQVMTVGDLVVVPVFDGVSSEDPTEFYRVTHGEPEQKGFRREDWTPYADLLGAGGQLDHAYGGFLVRTADRLVLIDTGVGPGQIGPFGPTKRVIRGGSMMQSLAQLGVDPGTITDIILTHLHPDHYGWASTDDARTFPNAVFRCHALDWDYFVTRPGARLSGFSATLPALAGRLSTWDRDGPLLPGIDARLAPGHTPGSTILVLSSGTARALLVGDVVHCPVELVDDEWASLGDVDPALARRTKVALARELEDGDVPAAGGHFPGLRFGRLLRGEGRRQWVV
jgi:glyoxylase-like metal-dependent hydrolase (beta-lactamase superfamily II)